MLKWIYNVIEKFWPDCEKTFKISITSTTMFLIMHIITALTFLFIYANLNIPEMLNVQFINLLLYLIAIYLILFKGQLTVPSYLIIFGITNYIIYSTYLAGFDKNAILILPVLVFGINSMLPVNNKHKNFLIFNIIFVYFVLLYIKNNINPIYGEELYFLHNSNSLFTAIATIFIIYNDKVSEKYINMHSDKEFLNLTEEVNKDYLTGLVNRRFLKEKISEKGFLQNSYIVLVDIDFFKSVNDTYGHNAGDTVLRDIAAIYNEHFTESDVICRWGGEEFIFIIRKINEIDIEQTLESLRKKVQKHTFIHGSFKINVTISFGVCTVNENFSVDKNIECADKAMYFAKNNGRNRVVFYEYIHNKI